MAKMPAMHALPRCSWISGTINAAWQHWVRTALGKEQRPVCQQLTDAESIDVGGKAGVCLVPKDLRRQPAAGCRAAV